MSKLTEHYRLLLGLDACWEVSDVSLSLEEKRVEILLVHRGGAVTCPECDAVCDAVCGIADHGPERTWRHLDTMQFETVLRARTPRTKCKTCGVKTVTVPWAGKHSRGFDSKSPLMFEAFAIEVLQACGSVKNAATLLSLNWKSVHRRKEFSAWSQLCFDSYRLDGASCAGSRRRSHRRGSGQALGLYFFLLAHRQR